MMEQPLSYVPASDGHKGHFELSAAEVDIWSFLPEIRSLLIEQRETFQQMRRRLRRIRKTRKS